MEGVRRAGRADLDRCRELVTEAIASSDGHRGAALLLEGRTPATLAGSLVERWDASEDSATVVGTFNEVIVGIAGGTVTQSGPRSIGRIECFYVESDARAVGVGQAMIESLIEFFTSKGCTDVDAMALPGDRSSKQLLESAGFKARLLILHRSLG
ncbi:MAG: GNAT family N-acetyltransferase [Acidimicrobiales bacterium]